MFNKYDDYCAQPPEYFPITLKEFIDAFSTYPFHGVANYE